MTPEHEGGSEHVKREPEAKEAPETSPEKRDLQAQEKVELEFPYDDLDFFYKYVLKELGIQNPFKTKKKEE